MSRSILLPLLGLSGIILFGTIRAGRPDPAPSTPAPGAAPVVYDATPQAYESMPPPPPGPRLRSEVMAEEPDTPAPPDTNAAAPREEPPLGEVADGPPPPGF